MSKKRGANLNNRTGKAYQRVSREKLSGHAAGGFHGMSFDELVQAALRLRRARLTIAEIGDRIFPNHIDGAGLVGQLLEEQPRHVRFKGEIGHIQSGYGRHQSGLTPNHG